MAYTHSVDHVWVAGVREIDQQVSRSDSAQLGIDEVIASDADDYAIDMVLDISEIAMILILSDQNIKIETNNGAVPVDTFNLIAGEPLVWWDTSLFTNPFSLDVTGLFVTNTAGVQARLQIEVLYDATP